MGLDQYAYRTDPQTGTRKEISYWRKHPNLQGWMRRLWESKGKPGLDPEYPEFNGVELELTVEDLHRLRLELDAEAVSALSEVGFFFGQPSDQTYREHDLKFVEEATWAAFNGFKITYNSSW